MKYFWLTLKHKWFVFCAGRKLKVPFYLLIMHDWTKFMPCELPHYQRQFYGEADDPIGFSKAWNHHQKCNKHHWEWWIPITGHTKGGFKDLEPLPMPEKYIREMVADWFGACRAYEGHYPDLGNWPWWGAHKGKILARCHPDTVKTINSLIQPH
ncbi:MAG: DUF5662 family protein [Dehalococcoidales bacterium]|nr:DUF5662 family protein [Dehalococcoidales bacterium]